MTSPEVSQLERLGVSYLDVLLTEGVIAESTAYYRFLTIRRFARWLGETPIARIDAPLVQRFLDSRSIRTKDRTGELSTLRHLLDWLASEGHLMVSPSEELKHRKVRAEPFDGTLKPHVADFLASMRHHECP